MTVAQVDLYGPVAAELDQVCRLFDAELASEERCVQKLVARVTRQRGKMIRPAILLLSGKALGRCDNDHLALATVIEMVHIASLVHDDVLDEADARRNTPSLNRLIGNEGAVLLGDYILAQAFRLCSSLRSHEVNHLLTDTCATVCLGELLQISNRHNQELAEGEYLSMIMKKTAWLMRACGLLGGTLAAAEPQTLARLGEYGLNLGMAFQVSDDLLDLCGTEEEMGKTLGRDLAKGDLTLPLIRFLNTSGKAARQEMVASMAAAHSGGLERIRRLLLESDCMEHCWELARRYTAQAASCLDCLPPSEARDALYGLASFVSSRRC
jgi:octaprenyl-diphosphate synthase